jgi:minor curlin subunit
MKANALISLLASLTLGTAHAQLAEPTSTSREQQLAETVGLERLPTGSASAVVGSFQNVATLTQNGTANDARIDQQNLGVQANQAYVAQVGTANVLGLSQTGSNNALSATQNGISNNLGFTQNGRNNSTAILQNGNNNSLQGVGSNTDFLLEGNDNKLRITQQGDNNTVKGEIRENNRNYEIRQYGSENKLVQIESTQSTPVGYTVEMRGRGINLTIEQSQVR